ncbi:hypothetical protein L1D59_23495, partial [Pseudoalteromonas piscicida]|uniref:hypothetical protein n=1 Tax=Pseudoalteromonas piscicida TaxID=43662 RepID=UPI001EFDADC2
MENRKLIYNFAYTVTSRGGLLLITLLLVRLLGESLYGYIAYFRSVSQIAEAGLGIALGVAVGRVVTNDYKNLEKVARISTNITAFLIGLLL